MTTRKKKRPGLPDRDSIVEVKELVSPSGKPYRILRTNEVDGYEERPTSTPPAGATAPGRSPRRPRRG